MPKISVIVPVYKVEQYLQRCVDSILTQTFEDFELILVDDGSPDGCPALCDEIAETDKRVHVIHKKNGGLSDARNAGLDHIIAHSDSEWVTFIGDDWIHPRYLEMLWESVKNSGAGVGICEFMRTSNPEEPHRKEAFDVVVWKTEEYFASHHLNANIAWAKLYPKVAFTAIRYPVGKIHEDEYTTYKILFEYDTVAAIVQPMYYYYINPVGIMGSMGSDQNLDRIMALEERVKHFCTTPHKTAYQISVESYVKMVAKKLNTPPISEGYSSKMIRLMKDKLRYVEKEHIPMLSEQGNTQVRALIDEARKEFRSHMLNRALVKCVGRKRYTRIKKRFQRG